MLVVAGIPGVVVPGAVRGLRLADGVVNALPRETGSPPHVFQTRSPIQQKLEIG